MKGIHRAPAGTKTARRIMAATAKFFTGKGQTREQDEWNKRVEAERAAKKARYRAKQKTKREAHDAGVVLVFGKLRKVTGCAVMFTE